MPAVPDSAAEHQRLRKARPIRTVARRWLSCVEFSKDLFSVKSFAPVQRSESVSDLCLHFTKAFGTNPLRRFQESKRFLDDLTGGNAAKPKSPCFQPILAHHRQIYCASG